MTELGDFLFARIAEDEATGPRGACADHTPMLICRDCPPTARALAECESKRRIVQRCELLIDSFEKTVNHSDEYIAWPDVTRREKSHAWATLYDLVRCYADHPDFQEGWEL